MPILRPVRIVPGLALAIIVTSGVWCAPSALASCGDYVQVGGTASRWVEHDSVTHHRPQGDGLRHHEHRPQNEPTLPCDGPVCRGETPHPVVPSIPSVSGKSHDLILSFGACDLKLGECGLVDSGLGVAFCVPYAGRWERPPRRVG